MFREFISYNFIGIFNTAIGFGLIVFLMFLGVSPIVSNMVGYGVGAIFSYYLNSKYTFNQSQRSMEHAVRFFAVLLVAYGLNFLVLKWTLLYLNPYIAQFIAASVYSLSAFLFAKFLIFKKDEVNM